MECGISVCTGQSDAEDRVEASTSWSRSKMKVSKPTCWWRGGKHGFEHKVKKPVGVVLWFGDRNLFLHTIKQCGSCVVSTVRTRRDTFVVVANVCTWEKAQRSV